MFRFFAAVEAEDAAAVANFYTPTGTTLLLDEPGSGNEPLRLTGRAEIEAANQAFFNFADNIRQRILAILPTDVGNVHTLTVNTIFEFDADLGEGLICHFTGWETWTFTFDKKCQIVDSVVVAFGDLICPPSVSLSPLQTQKRAQIRALARFRRAA